MTCQHLKSTVMESRRIGAEIYRRRTCGHCCKVFVSLETAPDGLKMPHIGNGSVRAARRAAAQKGEVNSKFMGWTRSTDM